LAGKPKLLWDAFLCGAEVSRAALEKAVTKPVVQSLRDRGICSAPAGKIKFGFNSLINCGGFAFFVNRGSLAEGYFGEDSRLLMSLRPRLEEGRALCLHTGTGAEIMALSAGGVAGMDIEAPPELSPYITTNLELNGLAGRARVAAPGADAPDGGYDAIIARVPGLLEFAGIQFPPLVSGGPGRLERWKELLARAQAELSARGRLVFIGPFYSGKESRLAARQLEELFAEHGLSASINISSKLAMELGIPIFNQTLAAGEVCGKRPRAELLPLFEKELEARGCTHAYLVKGIAWKSRRGAPGSLLDLSEHYYGTWLT